MLDVKIKTMNITEILGKINNGQLKKKGVSFYDNEKKGKVDIICNEGFDLSVCDINAAPFDVDLRYQIQTIEVPSSKRGNLAKYAGKKVDVIATTVTKNSPRINFYVKENSNS